MPEGEVEKLKTQSVQATETSALAAVVAPGH
jgi:hypothetical protein